VKDETIRTFRCCGQVFNAREFAEHTARHA